MGEPARGCRGTVTVRARASGGYYVPGRTTLPTPAEQSAALGAAIRRRRVARGLTQVEVGRRGGISSQQVNRVELGHTPLLDTLWRIAAALGTQPSALLGDAEDALHG